MTAGPAGLVPSLAGKPLPSQLTVLGAPKVQPAICRLTALTSSGIAPARKAACTSAIASGMLFAQSPVPVNAQFPALASGTVAQVLNCSVLPTVYRWPSY